MFYVSEQKFFDGTINSLNDLSLLSNSAPGPAPLVKQFVLFGTARFIFAPIRVTRWSKVFSLKYCRKRKSMEPLALVNFIIFDHDLHHVSSCQPVVRPSNGTAANLAMADHGY